jgi:hypothetical protein
MNANMKARKFSKAGIVITTIAPINAQKVAAKPQRSILFMVFELTALSAFFKVWSPCLKKKEKAPRRRSKRGLLQ